MTRGTKAAIVGTAAIVLLGATGIALAGPRTGRGERLARHLDLTETQREQIREIREARWSEGLGEAAKRHMETRRALMRAISDRAATEETVREAAKAHADAEVAFALERRETHRRIDEVLTPEQRAKVTTLRDRALTSKRPGRAPSGLRGGGRR